MITLIAATAFVLLGFAYAWIVTCMWGDFVLKHVDIGNTRAAIIISGATVLMLVPLMLALVLGVVVMADV